MGNTRCVGTRGYVDTRGYAWVCVDTRGYAWIRVGMRGCAWVQYFLFFRSQIDQEPFKPPTRHMQCALNFKKPLENNLYGKKERLVTKSIVPLGLAKISLIMDGISSTEGRCEVQVPAKSGCQPPRRKKYTEKMFVNRMETVRKPLRWKK